jgi:hypothetical protein
MKRLLLVSVLAFMFLTPGVLFAQNNTCCLQANGSCACGCEKTGVCQCKEDCLKDGKCSCAKAADDKKCGCPMKSEK